MNMMIDNWAVFIAVIVLLVSIGGAVFWFIQQPRESQLRKVREWLLFAVTEAERELGDGTGKLKLRYVYNLFIMRFEWLSKVISFEMFSDLVDQALDEMRNMLKDNPAARALVKGAPDDLY